MDSGDGLTVADDRFFAEVRRRHPDIDIVLLPQDLPPDPLASAGTAAAERIEVIDPVELAESLEADLVGLLPQVAPDIDTAAPAWRWGPGDRAGTVARKTLVAAESVEAVPGLTALSGAERALVAADWHVLVPPDGIPRVLARRADGAQVQILYVEPRNRYAVTLRSPSYAVGRDVAADLLREAPWRATDSD